MRVHRPTWGSRSRARSVELLNGLRGRRSLLFQTGRDRFSALEDAEQVLPGELAQIRLGPAAPRQLREQRRIRRDVLEPDRRVGDPVEVAADANVIGAGHTPDVIDVVRDILERRLRRWMRRAPRIELSAPSGIIAGEPLP